MRIAISPRLAIKTFLNILDYLTVLQFVGTRGGVVQGGGLVLVQRGFSPHQGGQAQGPHTSSSPPIVPTKSTVLSFVGTRGRGVWCGGLVLVQHGFSPHQGGQAQGPHTSSSPPIVPTKSNWVGVSPETPAGLPDLLRSHAAWRWSQLYNGGRYHDPYTRHSEPGLCR